MASSFPSLKRLQLIKEFGLNVYRSKQDFIDFLQDRDIYISSRTLNRDFIQLKDMGFDIIYNADRKKHLITDNFTEQQSLLDRLVELESLKGFEEDYSQLYQQYVIDGESTSQGLEFIRPLFEAIDKKLKTSFEYHKFDGTFSNRVIYPLQLKISQYRWYVLGHDVSRNALRIFGLDRMKNLKFNEAFDPSDLPNHTLKQLKLQRHYYGIAAHIFKEEKIQRVVLKVSKFLTEYWRSKPVHFSQEITEQTKDGSYIIELYVVPNIDLLKLIVSSLGEIEVLEPTTIQDYIRSNYSDFFKTFSAD